ncbi:MAG: hypothetical protein FD122_2678 [Stygiobacter sp.]|nr:MAG: hypothetical protein FD122_2678 [Stygiobacter sp.]KAF0215213.1 MAG: hypothetical protein FD178_1852 [Ignavibacteria bacterium]
MNEPQKILLTPEEEAKLAISLAFENASKDLTEKGIPTTPENLLPEFRANVEDLLTKNIALMVNLSDTTLQHEKELFDWLCKVEQLMNELFVYRKNLDTKSIAFLVQTQKTFEQKVKSILTRSVN